jgi:hypothetical protein
MLIQDQTSKLSHAPFLRAFFLTFGSAVVLLLLYLIAPSSIPESNRLLGMAVVVVGVLPAFFYIYRAISAPQSVGRLPLFPLIGALYALYYGLPAITQESLILSVRIQVALSYAVEALKLVLVGLLIMQLAFIVSAPILRVYIKPIRLAWDSKRAHFFAPILLLIGFFINISDVITVLPSAFQQIVALFGMFFELGIGIYIILGKQGELSIIERILLWFLVIPYYLFSQLSTGLTSTFAFAVAFLFFIIMAVGYRIRWHWLILVLLALILVRGSIRDYRQVVWYGASMQSSGRIERSQLLIQIAWERIISGGAFTVIADSRDLQNRASMLSTLAYVVSLTPTYIPYWHGETYITLPTTLIPRALWPDKPIKNLGQDFGHRYLFLDSNDRITSINLPQLIEMYVNFGWTGVLVGMFILGLIYQVLTLLFNQPDVSSIGILIGALIFRNLFNIESDFSLVFGAVLQTTIILYILLRLIGSSAPPMSLSQPADPQLRTV